MMESSVTISLVPEARSGPFVFHGDLEKSLDSAATIGFDGVELFLPDAKTVEVSRLSNGLRNSGLGLSALGTGAGFLTEGWTLSSPTESTRRRAVRFVEDMLHLGGRLQAPVIVGSMQGSSFRSEELTEARRRLVDSLDQLAATARREDTEIFLEPLNRFETNLVNRLEEGMRLCEAISGDNVRLLADLFHMNIEERSITEALRQAGGYIGHVHFVDSNRRPVGFGHLDLEAITKVLADTGFDGYLSAEALPYPNSQEAAMKTLAAFERYVQPHNAEMG